MYRFSVGLFRFVFFRSVYHVYIVVVRIFQTGIGFHFSLFVYWLYHYTLHRWIYVCAFVVFIVVIVTRIDCVRQGFCLKSVSLSITVQSINQSISLFLSLSLSLSVCLSVCLSLSHTPTHTHTHPHTHTHTHTHTSDVWDLHSCKKRRFKNY